MTRCWAGFLVDIVRIIACYTRNWADWDVRVPGWRLSCGRWIRKSSDPACRFDIILDLDSTVETVYGDQVGAAKGTNPLETNRYASNTHSSTDAADFLQQTFALLGERKVKYVRICFFTSQENGLIEMRHVEEIDQKLKNVSCNNANVDIPDGSGSWLQVQPDYIKIKAQSQNQCLIFYLRNN